jgi:hypothetical protein
MPCAGSTNLVERIASAINPANGPQLVSSVSEGLRVMSGVGNAVKNAMDFGHEIFSQFGAGNKRRGQRRLELMDF